MQASQKVALNTMILYIRMAITVVISLITTRLVLNALGSVDFGIFNLVAGVIAMLSFLNNAMATSTQRYLSYHQGRSNPEEIRKVFVNSFFLHFAIGLILVTVLELLGLLLFDGILNIPQERMEAAKTIYHLMSFTVFFTVLTVPFTASLISHENIIWVAIVNIVEALLKLLIAFVLIGTSFDKLVLFGSLTACITVVSFIMYAVFCYKKYKECQIDSKDKIERNIMSELSSFAGWNLFGSLCFLGKTQGLAIILNVFYGTVVNAAYGIANQVSSQLVFFSSTLLRAINPQIMKSEGAGDRERMLRLSMIACKFGVLLFSLIALPFMFEMDFILTLWLDKVPDYAVSFCTLMLVAILCSQLTIGIQSALQASGKVRNYQIVVGTVVLLTPVISYILLAFGYTPNSVFLCNIAVELVACILRLYYAKINAGLDLNLYLKRVVLIGLFPVFLAAGACTLVKLYSVSSFRPVMTLFVSSFVLIVGTYFTGLVKDEKEMVNSLVIKVLRRGRRGNKLESII